jgi:H+/Cl- antiporter ClcA
MNILCLEQVINRQRWLRPLIDTAMLVLYIGLMHFSLVGGHTHKALAGAVGVLFVVHVLLNWRFVYNLRQGEWNRFRLYILTVDVLLIVAMVITYVSAKSVGQHAFFNPVMPMALKVHQAAAWWALLIMGWHLGMHGNMFSRFLPESEGARKRAKIVLYLAALGGLFMAGELQLGQRLWGLYDFRSAKPETAILFYGGCLLLVIFNAVMSYLVLQILQRRRDDAGTKQAKPRNRAERRRLDRAAEKRAKREAQAAEKEQG